MATKKRPPPLPPPHSTGAERIKASIATANEVVASMPHNINKAAEYGHDNALAPPTGNTSPVPPEAAGSTLSEREASHKTGETVGVGLNMTNASLTRSRVDSGGQMLTTSQGVPVGDNQNSLKAGLRGPTLLEDFILREKITHFDHERIPERIVHARGSGAHGVFESYGDFSQLTRAAPLQQKGKQTPVFVRFSTVAGERGSKDTARDVRGFAVKFYTDEGNWDLVGNNMPVFFIQDAMKFPDLVHAVKPEPHHGMPQAASAHDTFWDFVSLMPESTHMLMWAMSDRAIPRSYRMMEGFGVHTFRLVNADGESRFCKFHWKPILGIHSLTWDEAVKISGADPDFHRRDLWEAIESGAYPQWEFCLQMFTEAEADQFSFDVLDPTKLVPEELVPVIPVGRLILNRNPDNFFAETEQVAFCAAHVIPGIDFTNDPLLAGRIHSYIDTQISRLGGANFHEIPINAPVAQVHNNQRDGLHRQAINRGRVAYEPNSLGGGCPFQAGTRGFVSFPQPVEEDKVRGKPEKFAEHYAQATLFYQSQTAVDQAHIAAAFRFELSKVQVPAIRERMVSSLRNVSEPLANKIADGLGMPLPRTMPKAITKKLRSEVKVSPALSAAARPGDGSITTRQVALIVAPGVDLKPLKAVHDALTAAGATPKWVGQRIGPIAGSNTDEVNCDASLENATSVLFDGIVLPPFDSAGTLAADPKLQEWARDAYGHCKTLMMFGEGKAWLKALDLPMQLPDGSADPGLVFASAKSADAMRQFVNALARYKHPERDRDPLLE